MNREEVENYYKKEALEEERQQGQASQVHKTSEKVKKFQRDSCTSSTTR
jgi:hypothetical protein